MPDAKFTKALPQGLNENYARELMELHTLGVNGGYTQADVTAGRQGLYRMDGRATDSRR